MLKLKKTLTTIISNFKKAKKPLAWRSDWSIGLKDLMILKLGVRTPLWMGAGLSDGTV
jgi:hypothetical protein